MSSEKENSKELSNLLQELPEGLVAEAEEEVKEDRDSIRIIQTVAISAYTDSPLNLFLEGLSGVGKSYTTLKSLISFPPEDVIVLSGASPTSFIHDARQEADNTFTLDWSRKVVVFLEAPSEVLFHRLLPILSHDLEEQTFKITDKDEKGRIRTKTVIVRGFPACIFISWKPLHWEALSTRGFKWSPNASARKVDAALDLKAKRAAYPIPTKKKGRYVEALRYIRDRLKNTGILIPFAEKLKEKYPDRSIRAMRDFNRSVDFIKAYAALHFARLPILETGDRSFLILTFQIYNDVVDLLNKLITPTAEGLAPDKLTFFEKVVLPSASSDGYATYEGLSTLYKGYYGRRPSRSLLSQYVDALEEAGLLERETDPYDKRKIRIKPKKPENTLIYFNKINLSEFGKENLSFWLKNILTQLGLSRARIRVRGEIHDVDVNIL